MLRICRAFPREEQRETTLIGRREMPVAGGAR
jgi:hypothetical protein